MAGTYISLAIAQVASFVLTLALAEGDPFAKPLFWAIVIFGLVWVFAGAITLGVWYASPRLRASEGFQERGVYRYVRHPLYTGFMIVAFSFFVTGPTVLGGIAFLLVVTTTVGRAGVEELMLMEKSPEYAEYRKRTHRFIPFVV